MNFEVLLEPLAMEDIQQAIFFYDGEQRVLGKKFELELHDNFQLLASNPFFQLRYDSVRCMPLKKFPFMIHFTIDEEKRTVIIRAIFHTSRNPQNWKIR